MKGIALISMVALVGCADAPGARIAGPAGPAFELVKESQRLDPKLVNVQVFGTFQVLGGGTAPRVLGLGKPEAAHFPGNPPHGAGTCLDGKWYNPKGHGTSGTSERPHPHCWDPGSEGMTIVLEPISGQFENPDPLGNTTLHFSRDDSQKSGSTFVQWVPRREGKVGTLCGIGECLVMRGAGIVYAYAIDAATGVKVGTLLFTFSDIGKKQQSGENLFECTLSGDSSQDGCLNLILDATYEPLPVEEGGVGTSQQVAGFLYWQNVSEQY